MRSLLEAQRAMQRAILTDDSDAPPIAPGALPRIGIYRYAYRARLANALRANYPALARMIGEEEFRTLAVAYARAHPSRHFSIRWHGHALAEHLPAGPLADLARMEWAIAEAFDAPDAAALDAERLAGVPVERWADLPLALHPSVEVLALQWAVEGPWERLRHDGDVGPQEIERRQHALVVWRKNLDAHWRSSAAEEARALLALDAGGSLQHACEALGDEGAGEVGAWFAGWVREGLLTTASAP
jgi:hypothetical protein